MPRDGLRQRKPTSTTVEEPATSAPTKQRRGRRKDEEPRSSLSSIATLSPTTTTATSTKPKKTRQKKKKKTEEVSSFSSVATTVSPTFSDVVERKVRRTKKKSEIENTSTTSVSTKVTDKQNDSSVTSSTLFSDMCTKYQDLLVDNNNENLAVYGLLYGERYQSFIQGQWPFADDRELTYNPHDLAMAGFVFLSKEPPTARCFVCFEIIECSNENECDPWLNHIRISPNCDYIKLGYPLDPDAFTMSDALSLCEAAWTNKFRKLASLCDKYVSESLQKIATEENDFD